ncbi:MAG TPA: TRAP transporter fused permease subunit [Symbiobacteriaceae bacterium]|nr:TRAP transporter fused permease subunit [Symbiobacteriaceae bacterium]
MHTEEAQVRHQDAFSTWAKRALVVVAVVLAVFHIYTAWFGALTAVLQRSLHLLLLMAAVFLGTAAARKGENKAGLVFGRAVDAVWLILSVVSVGYIFLNYSSIVQRLGDHTPLDIAMGGILVVGLLEATRRAFGWPLPIIAMVFILYGFFGYLLPPYLFGHQGYDLERIVSVLSYSTEGVFGIPLGASATIVAMFLFFSSLYNETGAGDQFMDLSKDLFGGLRAGPAKMAVVASSLFGTISGSVVANVVSTGTFTIPLMKKMGFSKDLAAAVEATTSSGGQIMPPVMGAAAFIMAEMLGVPYSQVMIAAIVPAVIYYVGLYMTVDLEASKLGLEASGERPDFRKALRRASALIPIAILFFFLMVLEWSPSRSALFTIAAMIVLDAFGQRRLWSLDRVLSAVTKACTGLIDVAISTAAAGLVVGIFSLTGLGLNVSSTIITASSDNVLVLSFLTMVTSLILGMGVTTAAAYLILAVIVAPVMTQLGVPPLAAHLFVFYFGCLSAITPPVAVGSYAAAGIAGGNFMRTGFVAMRIALPGFIVPFIFVLNPALLGLGSPLEVAYRIILSLVAVAFLNFGLVGTYGFKSQNLRWPWRVANVLTALLLLYPSMVADVVGLMGLAACAVHYLVQRATAKKAALAANIA